MEMSFVQWFTYETSTDERFNAERNQSRVGYVYSISTPAFAIVQLDKHNWNLNVVVYPHVMHFVREVQLRLPEIIDKVHDIVLTDRRVKVRELIKTTSTEISILHEQLSRKKIYR